MLGLLPIDREAVQETWRSNPGPGIKLSGAYFQLRILTLATRDGRDRPATMDMIAGPNFVVTIHPEPVDALAAFSKQLEVDTAMGTLDSGAFAAVLLDGFITSYLALADELESSVDRLDERALRSDGRADLLQEMVSLRHRIAGTRRALIIHREVVSALARADFEAIAGTSATPSFQALAERFERAVDSVDRIRESLVGTFEIHMTRTSQRTNEIMKTLTIVSVLLLPSGVIAGFMGMNEKPPYSTDDPRTFWVVVILIVVIAIFTLAALRSRRWI